MTPTGTLLRGREPGESLESLESPFAHPAAVKPGDTIWLRGGTYTGRFTSQLRGEPNKPIIVRQYPGERVTIDGNDGVESPTINVRGSYTWFWGFEITNSNTDPLSVPPATSRQSAARASTCSVAGPRLINLVVHDTGQGVLVDGRRSGR